MPDFSSEDYFGDTLYEVWRHGGNPDRVDRDRVMDYFDEDINYEHAARRELGRQRTITEV